MACRRLAPMRLVPFSYFCTCWNVTPSSLASAVWLRPSSRRLTRTREPTRTSVCVGPCFIWHSSQLLWFTLGLHYLISSQLAIRKVHFSHSFDERLIAAAAG